MSPYFLDTFDFADGNWPSSGDLGSWDSAVSPTNMLHRGAGRHGYGLAIGPNPGGNSNITKNLDFSWAGFNYGAKIGFWINPQLTLGAGVIEHYEGCLSVDGFQALVPRAQTVTVDALDHRGDSVKIEATGWYARILQHEIDHLDGTLYIDRMRTRSFTTTRNLTQLVAAAEQVREEREK